MDDAPPQPSPSEQGDVRTIVVNALATAGHRMLASMLESGEWQVERNELVIAVAASEAVIDMSLGADAKRLAIASASGALGRPLKLRVVSSGASPHATSAQPVASGGGRNRAEQDPIVRRMQERFGAEIRTIIDYKDKERR